MYALTDFSFSQFYLILLFCLVWLDRQPNTALWTIVLFSAKCWRFTEARKNYGGTNPNRACGSLQQSAGCWNISLNTMRNWSKCWRITSKIRRSMTLQCCCDTISALQSKLPKRYGRVHDLCLHMITWVNRRCQWTKPLTNFRGTRVSKM